jgi:hypothetical protein
LVGDDGAQSKRWIAVDRPGSLGGPNQTQVTVEGVLRRTRRRQVVEGLSAPRPDGSSGCFEFCAVRMSMLTRVFALAKWPCGSLLPLREMKGLGDLSEESETRG